MPFEGVNIAMSIVVETGSGNPDANSYVSLEEATEYFAWLGNDEWDNSDETILARATQAIDLAYGSRVKSTKLTADQGLAWPRVEFEDGDGFVRSSTAIPAELKKAVFEAAFQMQQGNEVVVNPDREGLVTKSTKKIGSMEITREYSDARTSTNKNTKIDLMLASLLKAGGRGLRNIKLIG